MEKIKQALEKARLQRQSESKPTGYRQSAVDISAIEYSNTNVVDCSLSVMKENRLVCALDHGKFSDAHKVLSTQVLQRMVENHWSSLAVTSADHGEGKTTTAINLGISIAREIDYTVLLVDANLRHSSVHEYFGVESKYGLSDYLTSDIDIADALFNPKGIDHFVVLPAGKHQRDSSELLGSPKMCALVEELTDRYPKRVIIFDMPPVLNTADTIAFLPCVDAALIVIEDDETRVNDLKTAMDMLSTTNVIGSVLNKSIRSSKN